MPNFNVKDLRLWGKNPRYTKNEDVKIKEIGREDLDNNKDIYLDNISSYYKKLIKNKRMIDKLFELVESISKGFEPDIDQILVSTSPWLTNINLDKYKDIYYVIEGNRRIFAMHLLSNLFNSRKVLKEIVGLQLYTKFNDIFLKKDYIFESIECKIFDLSSKSEEHVKRVLNSRHFGNRKGKLNWPRGLVLSSIYSKVLEFRKNNNILNEESLTDDQLKKLIVEIESFTGKKISDLDLKSSLWTITAINIFNKHNKNDQILLEDTNDELSEEQEDKEQEDKEESETKVNEIITKNYSKPFSISSLELAYNTIKVPDNKGNIVALKKSIDIKTDVKLWKVNTSIDEKKWEKLCCYIIESIKNGKLNTRRFESEYNLELISILSTRNIEEINKIIQSTKENKIYFKQLNISSINSTKKESIIFESKNEERIYKEIKENVLPEVDKIYEISTKLENNLHKVTNKFLYSLIYIWTKEFKPLVYSKSHIKVLNFPYLIASSLLRSTSESMCNLIVLQDNSIVQNFKTTYETEYKIKKTFKGKSLNTKLVDHIYQSIIKNILKQEISETYCSDCEGKRILSLLILDSPKEIIKILKNIKNILLTKPKLKNFIKLKSNEIDTLIPSFSNFISWTNTTKYLNMIIHKNYYIYDIINDNVITTITGELKSHLDIIFSFLTLLNNVLEL